MDKMAAKSFTDLMMVAKVLKDRRINDMVEFATAPGSREVLNMLAENGALADMISAGARILESGCGPCIGQGFSPGDGAVSLRTFTRNFPSRSGTAGDQVYLVSPETAVASALKVSPSNDTSAFGIGILPYLERIIPNNSLDSANVYFLIHCLPTSLI